ncbi:unnamed protein product [Prunus brigantina]
MVHVSTLSRAQQASRERVVEWRMMIPTWEAGNREFGNCRV